MYKQNDSLISLANNTFIVDVFHREMYFTSALLWTNAPFIPLDERIIVSTRRNNWLPWQRLMPCDLMKFMVIY